MSEFSIDHIVRDALHQTDKNPPWKAIPPFEDLELDDGNDIDKTVYQHLSGMTPSAMETDWDEFIDNHSEKIGDSHPVDEIIKTKIAQSTSDFEPTAWSTFVQTLELQNRRSKIIGGTKLAELLILLLLFWIGFPSQFLENNTQNADRSPAETTIAKDHTLVKVAAAEPKKSNQDKVSDQAVTNSENSTKDITSPENTKAPHVTLPQLSREASTSENSSQSEVLSMQENPLVKQSLTPGIEQIHTPYSPAVQNGIIPLPYFSGNYPVIYKNPLPGEASPLSNFNSNNLIIHKNRVPRLPQIPLSKLTELSQLNPAIMKGFERESEPSLLDKSQRPYEQTIGIVCAWNLNRIKTIDDPFYPIGERVQLDQNIYVGLEWEERTANNAFGLHAGYQQWHYLAPQYNEIFQRQGAPDLQFIRLDDLRFDVLSLGIFARKYISTASDWEFFLHFGGGFQLALNSSYRIRSGEIADINIDRDDLSPEEIARLPDIPKLWNKNFQEGVFQGGSINENSFMTVNIGGGVIRHLSDDWLIQFSPILTVSPFSDGLGPNRDNIQTLSFQFQMRRVIR